MTPGWDDYKEAFSYGGMLVIYVAGVTYADWQTLVSFLGKTEAVLQLYRDGKAVALPGDLTAVVGKKRHAWRLSIALDGIDVECPLGETAQMALVLDPRQIDSEERARILFRLMSTTGRRLRREVVLLRDDDLEQPLFAYRLGSGLSYFPTHR